MTRLSQEDGYSLAELLVVVAILGMVAAAILGVYLISQQTYTTAASLEDAQLGARTGLDRMAAELRLIGASLASSAGAITGATSTKITFLADVDGDTLTGGADATLTQAASAGATTVQVSSATGFSAGESLLIADGPIMENQSITGAGTTLTLSQGLVGDYPAGSIVRSVETVTYELVGTTLQRTVGSGAAEPIVDNVVALTLTYFDTWSPPAQLSDTSSQANRDQIREIEISLTAQGSDKSRRTMTSRVRPRNLGLQ